MLCFYYNPLGIKRIKIYLKFEIMHTKDAFTNKNSKKLKYFQTFT